MWQNIRFQENLKWVDHHRIFCWNKCASAKSTSFPGYGTKNTYAVEGFYHSDTLTSFSHLQSKQSVASMISMINTCVLKWIWLLLYASHILYYRQECPWERLNWSTDHEDWEQSRRWEFMFLFMRSLMAKVIKENPLFDIQLRHFLKLQHQHDKVCQQANCIQLCLISVCSLSRT